MTDRLPTDGEYAIEEIRRAIDHQIETNARYEEQALGLLKISLTGLYLLLTSVSVLYSTGYANQVDLPPIGESINIFENNLVSELPVAVVQAQFIADIALTLGMGLSILALITLIVEVPIRAYRVLSPSELEAGVPDLTRASESGQILERYNEIYSENESHLKKVEENWRSCYRSLRNGIGWFVASGLVWSSVIFLRSAWFTTIVLTLLSLVFAYRYRDRLYYSNIEQYLEVNPVIDGLMISCTIAAAIVLVLPFDWLEDTFPNILGGIIGAVVIVVLLFSAPAALLYGILEDRESMEVLLERNARFYMALFLSYLMVSSTTTESMREGYALFWQSFGIFVFTVAFFAVLNAVSILSANTIENLSERISQAISPFITDLYWS